MQKNEHKALAHLARAQQLLKPSDRDLLGFGTRTNRFEELGPGTLKNVFGNLDKYKGSMFMRANQKMYQVVKKITKKVSDNLERRGILMKHHKYWERHEHEQVYCSECVDSLEGLCAQRLDKVVTEELYRQTLDKVFSKFFETEPHPLSAIDFVRMCVLQYPSPYSTLLVDWLRYYLFFNSPGWDKEMHCFKSVHDGLNQLEINLIVDMINDNYQNYKSRVSVIHDRQLPDELHNVKNCNKIFIVEYTVPSRSDGINYNSVSCIFVSALKLHKSVFVLGPPDKYETAFLAKSFMAALKKDPNYTFYQLESRDSSNKSDSGVLAIEDSVRLFLNPDVPHVPDDRAEPFWEDFPIVKIKHAPGSHLLTYSQCFCTHNLGLILGKESKYVWLEEGGQHQSCLLETYKCLYKLHLIRKTCSDDLARR